MVAFLNQCWIEQFNSSFKTWFPWWQNPCADVFVFVWILSPATPTRCPTVFTCSVLDLSACFYALVFYLLTWGCCFLRYNLPVFCSLSWPPIMISGLPETKSRLTQKEHHLRQCSHFSEQDHNCWLAIKFKPHWKGPWLYFAPLLKVWYSCNVSEINRHKQLY